MAQTTPPSLTAPPTTPSRSDSANFASRADAFLAWFATLYADMVAALANVYGNAVDAYNNAVASAASAAAALVSQSAAANSALAAAASAGASAWVSGTTYAIGDVRWSPATKLIYRRKTAGAGTTDPSADVTNWALASTFGPQLIEVAGTTQTAAVNGHYVLTHVALTTITAPPNPSSGDGFWITPCNALGNNVFARNTGDGFNRPIHSLAENYTLDNPNTTYKMLYINATVGWRRT